MGPSRLTTYAGVAALAAVGAATAVVVAAQGFPESGMVVDGVVVARGREAPVHSVRVSDGDPATLVVAAGWRREGPPAPCYPHTEVRVVAQEASYVRLGAYLYGVPSGDDRLACALVGRPPAEVTVSLDAPLGDRAVYANGNAEAVPVGDPADVLRATRVPDGFAARGETAFGAEDAVWRTDHAGPARGERLTIRQGTWSHVGPPARGLRVLARPVVRGHEATVYDFGAVRCVSWREDETAGVSVCHSGAAPRVSVDALRDVADGLRALP